MNTISLSFLRNFHWNVYYNNIEPKHQGTTIKKHMGERRTHFIPILELVFHYISYSTISAFYIWNYNLNDSVLGIREQTDGITRVEYLNFKSSMDEYRVEASFCRRGKQ